jgi:tetratricopeptide (TPR) repeat protein
MIELLLQAERALSMGLVDQAERLYRQAADADPRNSIAVVGLARVELERGDDAAAWRLARRALAIDPENAAARRMVERFEEVWRHRGQPLPDLVGTTVPATAAADPVAAVADDPASALPVAADAPPVEDVPKAAVPVDAPMPATASDESAAADDTLTARADPAGPAGNAAESQRALDASLVWARIASAAGPVDELRPMPPAGSATRRPPDAVAPWPAADLPPGFGVPGADDATARDANDVRSSGGRDAAGAADEPISAAADGTDAGPGGSRVPSGGSADADLDGDGTPVWPPPDHESSPLPGLDRVRSLFGRKRE